jgi:hypothetical protein
LVLWSVEFCLYQEGANTSLQAVFGNFGQVDDLCGSSGDLANWNRAQTANTKDGAADMSGEWAPANG